MPDHGLHQTETPGVHRYAQIAEGMRRILGKFYEQFETVREAPGMYETGEIEHPTACPS
jgi:hypothetical protein